MMLSMKAREELEALCKELLVLRHVEIIDAKTGAVLAVVKPGETWTADAAGEFMTKIVCTDGSWELSEVFTTVEPGALRVSP
jgi:hypothetical protein